MPATRSATRSAAGIAPAASPTPNDSKNVEVKTPSRKRKPETTLVKETAQKVIKKDAAATASKLESGGSDEATTQATLPAAAEASSTVEKDNSFVPAVLSFDFEEAKNHLIQVDHRFEDLFSKMKCKPFEHLEQVHPFRALATSILGQQISWLAARSITHKFIRLYDPTLPEKPTDEERKAITSFPTPQQVASTEIAVLRTAGLSARKGEYIHDLAQRFADGRLSTKKLLEADDEELAKMLIEVRGIGRWTVDMFAIFSLRRADILPVGDLGVQRGLVRWFLSLYSPSHSYSISPEKVGGSSAPKKKKTSDVGKDELPSVEDAGDVDASSVVPGTSTATENLPSIPPAFTPSIKKTLNKAAVDPGKEPTPLPSGIDVALLKSRLDGKKKIKGAFLTPQEMAALTECWKPYRSLGVYYMWSLADAE